MKARSMVITLTVASKTLNHDLKATMKLKRSITNVSESLLNLQYIFSIPKL